MPDDDGGSSDFELDERRDVGRVARGVVCVERGAARLTVTAQVDVPHVATQVTHDLAVREPAARQAVKEHDRRCVRIADAIEGEEGRCAHLRAHLALALRVVIAALLVLALIGVSLPQVVDRQATVFVADVSASTRQAAALDGRLHHPRRQPPSIRTMPSPSSPPPPARPSSSGLSALAPAAPVQLSAAQPTDGTDLAAGLRLAADLLPTGYRPRDRAALRRPGDQRRRRRAARSLHARGVRSRRRAPRAEHHGAEVLVDSVSTPQTSSAKASASASASTWSRTSHTEATVHVSVNGQPIADQTRQPDTGQHRPGVRRPGAASRPARRARHRRRQPGHADAEQRSPLGRRSRRVRRAC